MAACVPIPTTIRPLSLPILNPTRHPSPKPQAGGFRPEDARFYAANVLSALEYIHGKGR